MKVRRLTPELLDELPPDSSAARASRRDLRALNAIMGHRRAWTRWLREEAQPRAIAELGTGDGAAFTGQLLASFPKGNGSSVFLVDREPCVSAPTTEKLRSAGWVVRVEKADVFDWLGSAPNLDVICANLFLHHFEDAPLARMLAAAAKRTSTFAALEPRRGWMSLAGVAALPLMDAHPVTRHDARVSVEAGFCGRELSSLWPHDGWHCEERRSFPFSHWFCARRK